MSADAFLQVEGLSRIFAGGAGLRRATFTLERGSALGIVGPSGSGKSTLARCLAGFESPDTGSVRLDGRSPARGEVQLIFQEAAASLNPRFTAAEIVAEPSVLRRRKADIAHWLEAVGMPAGSAGKAALSFSGGERQRLALARALAAEPKLLILDETFSGLDIVLQAQLSRLLDGLRRRLGLTCLLIAHDLGLAGRAADEIAVMDAGEIVERASAAELFAAPAHPRSRALVAACRALALEGS
jgi:ABC-type dipeptide/oligopeptide/nickel transport system ATPase subunit